MISRLFTSPVIVSSVSVVAVLGVGGALTRIGPWYMALRKPSWQPPGWVFAPVWTTIGVLTTCSAVSAWHGAAGRGASGTIIGLYAANGALNIAWSGLFFALQRPDWSLVEVVPLWLSVLVLAAGVAPYSTRAAWLLMPYLLWVGVAAFLNLAIVRLNAPFEGLTAQA